MSVQLVALKEMIYTHSKLWLACLLPQTACFICFIQLAAIVILIVSFAIHEAPYKFRNSGLVNFDQWVKLDMSVLKLKRAVDPTKFQLKEFVLISASVAEALLTCKSTVNSRQFGSRAARYPCLGQRACVNCYKLNDQGVVSLLPKAHTASLQTRTIKVSPFAPKFWSSQQSIQSQGNLHKTRNLRIKAGVNGNSGVPTLTALPPTHINKPQKQRLAAIVGGIGAALLVVIIVILVYIGLMHVKKFLRQRSETALSVPSPPVDGDAGNTSLQASALSPYGTTHLRQLTILELEHATCNFSQNNIIGEGGFGLVYKGLLLDGSIVAIKRRLHTPTQFFAHEVKQIARIQHKHLVKLIGFCEENHQQLLVYDYFHNGNVGNHLYDSEGIPTGKLEIWQRLSIALGAAQGLEHLHSLVPSSVHMHFRTSNVLVDENFAAKVSDFGISRLLADGARAGSSSAIDCFLDPELRSSKSFSETSDVYSYGVFLLELISGRQAHGRDEPNLQQNLVQHAKCMDDLDDFVDKALRDGPILDAVKEMMELALACVDISARRPTMKKVVEELERIQQGEIGRLQAQLSDEIVAVTLGSELFK